MATKFVDPEKVGSHFAAVDTSFLYVRDLSDKDNQGKNSDIINSERLVASDENVAKMNVWIVNDSEQAQLLKHLITTEDLKYTTAMLLLDFEKPWNIMNSFDQWMTCLREVVSFLIPKLPFQQQEALKSKLVNLVKLYSEPELDEAGKLIKQLVDTENEETAELLKAK